MPLLQITTEPHATAYAAIALLLCAGFMAIGYFFGYTHGKEIKHKTPTTDDHI